MSTRAITKSIQLVETATLDNGDKEKLDFLEAFRRELELRRKKLSPEVWKSANRKQEKD